MQRLTKRTPAGAYLLDSAEVQAGEQGVTGRAVERLAAYEELRESLAAEQEAIARRLEQMRREGKEKTVQFREWMVKKLNNALVLDLFAWHGL